MINFKNKNIYIPFLIILFFIFLNFILYSFNKDENLINNNENKIITNTWVLDSSVSKNIDSSMKNIDPNNYESLAEFLNYFNTWSWINLTVDLLKEDFYIKIENKDNFIITKFNKELVAQIDETHNKNIKNQAIWDIFESYKKNKYVYWEPNNIRSWVKILSESELPLNSQLHNNILLPYTWESFLETKQRLESIKNKTPEDNTQLSYIYDFSWDYVKSLLFKEKSWLQKINYKITWKVYNWLKNQGWAKVEILNYDNVFTHTNDKWEYTLEFETYPLTRLRLRATYPWISDWYNWVYIVYNFDNQYSNDVDFSLHDINSKFLIKESDLKWWNTKIIKSTIWNTFEFKQWVLIDNNWSIYNWDFYAYIYEFSKNIPWMQNFLGLDNFDDVYWYVWDKMITNWMTYLLITDLNWNELYISKKNPIVTKQKVDINYLLNNSQNWTSALTEEQLNLILEKSQEGWYPIDREFLIDRKISWYAPWWVLNKTKGIWENRWFKLLNKDWLKESLYYNVD